MSSSSPRGEQVLGDDEDDEREGSRSSVSACSVPCSALRASTQYTNSKKKYKIRRLWLPCFLRRSRRVKLVDKATSTTDLYPPTDAPQVSDQQDHRQKPPTVQGPFGQVGYTPGNEECIDRLSTCDWICFPPTKHRSPRRHLTPPRERCPHRHTPPPRDKDTHPNIVEPPEGDAPCTPRLEAPARRDSEKSTGGALLSREPLRGDSPSREPPRGDSPSREPPNSRRSPGGGRSPGGRPRCRNRLPKWKKPGERDSPGRKSPVWKRAQSPREKLPEVRSPRWKNTYGWQDMSPPKDETAATHLKSRDKTKSAPHLRTQSTIQRMQRDRDGQALAGRTGVLCGPAVAMMCCLLVAVAVFIGSHTFPACVDKVSWAVMPREGLLLELVSVGLLLIATASILILVDGLLGLLTELAIAFILVLYNSALVDLGRCLCFIPGRCLWLTVIVLPLFLLTLFVLRREKMAAQSRPT